MRVVEWFRDRAVRKVVRLGLPVVVGKAVGSVTSLVTLALLAHHLDLHLFGVVAMIRTVVMVIDQYANFNVWQAIVRFPLGIASDWLGKRRPFIFLGFLLAGLGAWLMGSASGIQGVLIGRAVTGLAAASWVVLVVAFSSLFPPREAVRAAALLSLVNSASRMLGTASEPSVPEMRQQSSRLRG